MPAWPGLAGRGVPAALHYAVVEAVPCRARGVPHPRAVLHKNLGVGAERFLADGAPVQRRDRDPAQVDRAEHGERQGQHDVVGGHVADRAAAVEAAAVSRPLRADGDQAVAGVQRPARQPAQDAGDELVVAAVDAPFLVGAGQLGRVARLGAAVRAGVLAEQVDEVEGGRLVGRAAELVQRGGDAQRAEVRRGAAGDVAADPLGHGHAVEAAPARVVGAVQLRPGRGHVGGVVEELPAPFVPVPVQCLLRPFPPVEAHDLAARVGARRVLVGVVQPQPEPFRQGQRRGVLGVDELGVLLDQLAVVEEPAQGPDPPAGDRVPLVDLGPDPVPVPQPQRAAQPGDPGADDDHPRCVPRGAGRLPPPGERGTKTGRGGRPGRAEHGPPGDRLVQQVRGLVDPAARLPGETRHRLRPADRRTRTRRTPRSHHRPLAPARARGWLSPRW